MDAPKLIAITGGTGFLGRSVVRCLLEQNDHSVRALTRRPQTLGGVEWIGGDLTDHSALEALCAGADTVIHIAGLTKARKLQHLLDVNEHGAASVAKAAQAGGVKRFILISSIAAREPHLSPLCLFQTRWRDSSTKYRQGYGASDNPPTCNYWRGG